MIAPIREPDHWSDGPTEALRRARRIVAEALLPRAPREQADAPRRSPAWQGWLFATWALVVAVCYFMTLIGR